MECKTHPLRFKEGRESHTESVIGRGVEVEEHLTGSVWRCGRVSCFGGLHPDRDSGRKARRA